MGIRNIQHTQLDDQMADVIESYNFKAILFMHYYYLVKTTAKPPPSFQLPYLLTFSKNPDQQNSSPFCEATQIPQLSQHQPTPPKYNRKLPIHSNLLHIKLFKSKMNMSHLGIINKSIQSNQSPANHTYLNQSKASIMNQNSYIAPMPENGGMLKKAMRFQYQFSTTKKEPLNQSDLRSFAHLTPLKPIREFEVESRDRERQRERERERQIEREREREREREQKSIFMANVFSCMDSTDYQRDFQISPKIISKE